MCAFVTSYCQHIRFYSHPTSEKYNTVFLKFGSKDLTKQVPMALQVKAIQFGISLYPSQGS